MDTHVLSWLHPERLDLLYPNGIPCETKEDKRYKKLIESGVARTKKALNFAREHVVLL